MITNRKFDTAIAKELKSLEAAIVFYHIAYHCISNYKTNKTEDLRMFKSYKNIAGDCLCDITRIEAARAITKKLINSDYISKPKTNKKNNVNTYKFTEKGLIAYMRVDTIEEAEEKLDIFKGEEI